MKQKSGAVNDRGQRHHALCQLLPGGFGAVDDVTLVVLDGTWRQAKRLYREFGAALQRLPAVCLEAPRDDRIYHAIRREPGAAQLSTFESVAAVLASLEGDASLFSTLIAPLSLFVAQQVGERDAAAARGNLKALNARRRAAADG